MPLLPTTRAVMRRCLLLLLLASFAAAQSAEQRTAHYLDSVRKQPPLLLAFVRDLPKGGDLHNHLDGAIYAEDLVDFAASGNLCVDRTSSRLLAPPCDPARPTPPNPRPAALTSITCSTAR
jgi:adenosine deaminase